MTQKKAPISLRIVAGLAVITMLVLTAAGFKTLFSKPTILHNTTTRVITSDSVINLKKRVAALEQANAILAQVAEVRGRIIYELASPLQALADTLLLAQRTALSAQEQMYATIQEDGRIRAQRYASLDRKLDGLASKDDVNQSTSQTRAFLLTVPPRTDTLHIGMQPVPARRYGMRFEPFAEMALQAPFTPEWRVNTLSPAARLGLRISLSKR